MPYKSTKRGKPVKEPPWWRSLGFHWFGRDDRGVHIWEGKTKYLKFGAWLLIVMGVGSLTGSIAIMAFGPAQGAGVLAGVGVVHTSLGIWMNYLRKRIDAMFPADAVAKKLDLTPDEVERLLGERGVKPKVIVNGEALFDIRDFDDSARLLRAAGSPQTDELLRPAGTTTSDVSRLVRPAAANEETAQPTTEAETVENRLTLHQENND